MYTYKEIPNRFTKNEIIEYVPPEVDMSIELVNRSYFVPNKEANKILARQNAAQLLDNLAYDSEEDIRSGAVNVYARRKGRDLAELHQQNLALVKEGKAIVDKAKAVVMKQVNAATQASSAPAPSPAPSNS